MSKVKKMAVRSWTNRKIDMSKVKNMTRTELEEQGHALDLEAGLEKALQFLHEHRAKADLIDAVWEAIEDNEKWINEDILIPKSG
jgi:hypothetical protein